ncbi:hypothetical protein ACFLWG_01250 [Chloroflexota bacterium]
MTVNLDKCATGLNCKVLSELDRYEKWVYYSWDNSGGDKNCLIAIRGINSRKEVERSDEEASGGILDRRRD